MAFVSIVFEGVILIFLNKIKDSFRFSIGNKIIFIIFPMIGSMILNKKIIKQIEIEKKALKEKPNT